MRLGTKVSIFFNKFWEGFMEVLENQKQNKFQTFSCGRAKVTFDENGYIVKAKDFSTVMWCTPNQDEELIGKHIIELAKILKKYAASRENYISFLENVVLKFYESQAKDGGNKHEIKEEKGNPLIKTKK